MGAGGQIEGTTATNKNNQLLGKKHRELVKRSDFSSLFATCKTAYGILCPSWGSCTQEGYRHTRESTADVPEPGAHGVPKESEKAGLVLLGKERGSKGGIYYSLLLLSGVV